MSFSKPKKKTNLPKNKKDLWLDLKKDPNQYQGCVFKKVSVVVLTYNDSQSIKETINSILNQEYPDIEVIIIDGGSQDRTVEIIKSFYCKFIKIHSFSGYHTFEMINKGISLANGEYINFMISGNRYLQKDTIKYMLSLASDHRFPDLVYGGSLLRFYEKTPRVLFRPLTKESLFLGLQPTSLQACWFRASLFSTLGKFETDYSMRGIFEYFCRFYLNGKNTVVSSSRVIVEFNLTGRRKKDIIIHFKETWKIIYKHFGWAKFMKWIFYQQEISRFVKSWLKTFKVAFLGEN